MISSHKVPGVVTFTEMGSAAVAARGWARAAALLLSGGAALLGEVSSVPA